MSIRRLAATITAARLAKEDAGNRRLLKAIFEPESTSPAEELPIPSIHPYSIIWNLVDPEPSRWN